jgi:hippurate hydrolase
MQAICKGVATAYDAEVNLDIRHAFTVLENDHDLSSAYLDAAADIVGADHVSDKIQPATGSEDFADMLKSIPGAYCRVGHVGTVGLHNPSFTLGLEVLPVGASIMARVAEKRLTPNAV